MKIEKFVCGTCPDSIKRCSFGKILGCMKKCINICVNGGVCSCHINHISVVDKKNHISVIFKIWILKIEEVESK